MAEQPALDGRAGEAAVEFVNLELARGAAQALDVERPAPAGGGKRPRALLAERPRSRIVVRLDPLGAAHPARVARADYVRDGAVGSDQRLKRVLQPLERMEQRDASRIDIREVLVDAARVAEKLLHDPVRLRERAQKLRLVADDIHVLRRIAPTGLRHERKSVPPGELCTVRVAARDRRYEWQPVPHRELRAQPLVDDDAGRLGTAAQQARGKLGAALAQPGQEHDVVVAARNDEVDALAGDDLEKRALERVGLRRGRRNEIDGIAFEQRRLVRHRRGRDDFDGAAA